MTRLHRHDGPPSPEEDAAIAEEALAERDFKHAASHLAGALAEDPLHTPWLALVDRIIQEAPEPLAAVPIDGPDPTYFGIAALRGLVLIRTGMTAEGLELLLGVLARRPERRGYITWALDALQRPESKNHLDSKPVVGFLGELLRSSAATGEMHDGRAILASFEPLLKEFFRLYPSEAMIHLAGSYLLRRTGKSKEAEAAARVAENLKPDALTAAACASAMRDDGRLDEALTMFRKALEREPGAIEVKLDMADSLLDVGRLKEARTSYDEVLALDPDHPWALPSKYFCAWQETREPNWIRLLHEFAAGQPENSRAAELNARCKPFEQMLPPPTEASINIFEHLERTGSTGIKGLSTSSLEAPSVHLCFRMGLGKDIHIDVPGLQEPDPTIPRAPVKYLLWKYEGELDPVPQGNPPSEGVARAVAAIAAQPFERERWWAAAHETSLALGPSALPEVLALMVHPTPAAKGIPVSIWIHRLQFAAAFVAAHLSWKDLLDVARGPMDWTVEAAAVALARLAIERQEAREEILGVLRDLVTTVPRPGHCCYEYAVWCVLPWLPNTPEDLRREAVRARTEIEASWSEDAVKLPSTPEPAEELSTEMQAEANRIREQLDRKYGAPGTPLRTKSKAGCSGMLLVILIMIVMAWAIVRLSR